MPLVLVLVADPALAQEVYAFSSGLRVAVAPDPTSPRVATAMAVAAGSLDDPEGREGVAHLVEHLWFDSREDGEATAWDTLRALGCDADASTWLEYTDFRASCPASALDALLSLELRRLYRPLAGVDDVDLALARRVVLAEEAEDGRERVLASRLLEALYPADHPLHARARRPELAPGLTRHDVETFAGIHYVPANATLAITGGLSTEAVLHVLEARLGPAVASPPPRTPSRSAPAFRRALRVAPRTIEAPVDHPRVTLAWALPPGLVGGFERAALVDLVEASFDRRFRYDPRVLSIGCDDVPSALATPLVCALELADDAPADIVAAQVRAHADTLWWGSSAAYLRQVFPASRSQHAVAVHEAARRHDAAESGTASWLALSVLLGGDADPFARTLRDARRARVRDVLDVAREHLAPERALVVIWRPREDGPPAPDTGEAPIVPDHPSPPVARAAVTPVVAAARVLPNGLRLLAVQRPDVPQLHAAARVAWGDGFDGAAEVVARRSDGSTPRSLLRDVLPFDGGDARGAIHGVVGEAAQAEAVLERLRDRVASRVTWLDPREPWLARARATAAREREHAAWWAEAVPLAALDAAGDTVAELAAAGLDAMGPYTAPAQRDVVDARARARYRPENTEIVLIGPDTPERMLATAEHVFSAWRVPPGEAGEVDGERPLDAGRVVVIDDPSARRARLAWRCPVGPEPTARALAGEIVDAGVFEALRGRTGWAYSPSARLEAQAPGAFELAVSAWVPVDRVAEALAAVETVVTHAASADAETRDRVREAWIWRSAPAVAPPEALAALALGPGGLRTPEELAGWVDAVRAVDGDAIARVLDGCVAGARVGVSGPAARIAADLAAAGRPAEVWTLEDARTRVQAR